MNSAIKGAYYEPSGKFSMTFFLYFLLSLVIAIPILSVVYVHLVHYIPIIYLNIFIAIGCGFIAGLIMSHVTKLGKARNPKIVLFCTFVAICVFEYIQWCVYVPLIFSQGSSFGERILLSLYLFTNPDAVFNNVSEINKVGVWSIGRGSRTSSDTVSGTMLLIVWIIEFIIISGMALLLPLVKAKFPFSEKENNWYVEVDKLVETDMPENFDDMKNNMENGNFTDLVQLAKEGKTDAPVFLNLIFYEPPQPLSGDPYYIEVEQVTISVDKKNKEKRDKKTLITFLSIDKQSFREITQAV